MQANIKKRKRVKHTRFPNGFGSITYLSGNRRRPYWVKKTTGFNSAGHPIYLTIGYFETFDEAFVALCEYNHEPYDVKGREMTFSEVAEKWATDHIEQGSLSEHTIANYRASEKKCETISNRRIVDITADELQDLVGKQAIGSQKEIIKYLHQVFRLALQKEIIKKDPTTYLHTTGTIETKRNPFTVDEVRAIWNMPESEMRNGTLIMLYTGMRVSEFSTISEMHENYIVAGEKTKAGKNRIIPLHTKIRPLMQSCPRWSESPHREFVKMFPGHSPHDCRRTFISRCVECGIDGTVARKITGHAGKDVHERAYTFLNDPAFLCREIEKICY